MPVPIVTAGADQIFDYQSSGTRVVNLSASATESPSSYEWTLKSAPPGSVADVGVNGDFEDGVSNVQNPSITLEANVEGTWTFTCVATNSSGSSRPANDLDQCQTLIVVKADDARDLIWPGDYSYNWGERYLNPTLKALAQGGGLDEPFWEWNGEDLSQFLTPWVGPWVNAWDVMVSPGIGDDRNWIWLEVSAQNAGSGYGDWILMLIPDVTPPSRNYVIVADMGSIIPGQDPVMYMGVRVEEDVGPYGSWIRGYFLQNNRDWGEMIPSKLTVDSFPNLSVIMPVDDHDREISQFASAGGELIRMMMGAEGPKLWANLPNSVFFHMNFRSHLMLEDFGLKSAHPLTNVGKPAIGVSNIYPGQGTARAAFRNIRCYELKTPPGQRGGGPTWY